MTNKENKMSKLRIIAILTILILAFSSTITISFSQPLSATDATGFTLSLSQPPNRIISLAPGNTEILFALGLNDKIVGVTTYCDEPIEALKKEKIGNVTEIDLEKILTLQPDLILASSLTPEETVARLHELSLPVFTLKSDTIEEVIEDITKVAVLSGVEIPGSNLIKTMKDQLKKINDLSQSIPDYQKPLVFHIIWHDPIWTAGNSTFINEFITLAGGKNLAEDIQGYSTIDFEEILKRNPSIITVIENHGKNEENQLYQFVTTDNRLQTVAAIKNNQVYLIDSNLVSRPGPRVVSALQYFAQIIHPEIFGEYQNQEINSK
jgi:iron complex transport system substrate-binding protein